MAVFAGVVQLAVALAAVAVAAGADGGRQGRSPLRVVVMDPLSDQLACDCVAGYARRNYARLAEHLQSALSRPVELVYTETLLSPRVPHPAGVDLILGKTSEVVADAGRAGVAIRLLAALSDPEGEVTQTGLFVVRDGDPARSIEDLQGRRILFGPAASDEKHAAALATLEAFDVAVPKELAISGGCSTAALAVVEGDADAAVVSSYAMPLLEGCGTIDRGALRIIGRTDPVPFIGAFVSAAADAPLQEAIARALAGVRNDPHLLAAMESKRGFLCLAVPVDAEGRPRSWPDWRGSGRNGASPSVPKTLPAQKRLLWSHTMTGPGMSGLAVAGQRVVVADKSLDDRNDIFRCLDADTGRQQWKLSYPAPGEMDFTNSPRANPVISDGHVYLLGAYGHLHCVALATGRVAWRKNLATDFGGEVPNWGFCSTPLVVDDKLIVNPGAPRASLVALDRGTGRVVWKSPGDRPGYAALILATLGGVRQIVGYDAVSLGGWDPASGKRLWRLVPKWDGDFNVPTPLAVDGKLLVSTENNGTRLYGFDARGRILPQPLAENEDLAPDMATPAVAGSRVLGSCYGLVCLDLDDGLKTVWRVEDDPFADYCALIAGPGRVLAVTQTGTIAVIEAGGAAFRPVATLDLFDDLDETDRDVWSHPALVGNRLYVRNLLGAYCFLID